MIRVFDGNRLTHSFQAHDDSVVSLASLPNQNEFISCSHDSTIKRWDVRKFEALQTLEVKNISDGRCILVSTMKPSMESVAIRSKISLPLQGQTPQLNFTFLSDSCVPELTSTIAYFKNLSELCSQPHCKHKIIYVFSTLCKKHEILQCCPPPSEKPSAILK